MKEGEYALEWMADNYRGVRVRGLSRVVLFGKGRMAGPYRNLYVRGRCRGHGPRCLRYLEERLAMERQPLPGILDIRPSDPVRVTITAPAEMEPGDGGEAAATVLSWAKGAPRYVEGAWMVEVVGVGLVPAGQVRRVS